MKWTLTRKDYLKDGIFGEIRSEDGKNILYTLEHSYEIDGVFKPKIEEGLRDCSIFLSPKHGYQVPLLMGESDSGRFFEIHIGNYNKDSDGCILVGLGIGKKLDGGDMLISSGVAFDRLMKVGVSELLVVKDD